MWESVVIGLRKLRLVSEDSHGGGTSEECLTESAGEATRLVNCSWLLY